MGIYALKVQDTISSAHFLRHYEGKCKNLHGHNWKVQVTIAADTVDGAGMVADFGVLKQKLRDVLASCDHTCLNDLSFFKTHNPTTENIARYVYEELSRAVAPLTVKSVEVWESDACSVVYSP